MNKDSRGIGMTGADAFAVARYERALEQFQSYVGAPTATIDEAVQASPKAAVHNRNRIDVRSTQYEVPSTSFLVLERCLALFFACDGCRQCAVPSARDSVPGIRVLMPGPEHLRSASRSSDHFQFLEA